jgi:DNA polymerase-3 subunit epsilon
MEPRNLTAAYAIYCGKDLVNAHDAAADAEASLDVFLAQLEYYKGRPGKALPESVDALHEFCAPGDPARNVDSRGRFVWRHGEAAFSFGKHRTRTLQEVVKTDRNYVEWVARTKDMGEAADICWKALQGVFPKKAP